MGKKKIIYDEIEYDEYGIQIDIKNKDPKLYNVLRQSARNDLVSVEEFRETAISYLTKLHKLADDTRHYDRSKNANRLSFDDFYTKLSYAKSNKDIHMVCMKYSTNLKIGNPKRVDVFEKYFSDKDKIEVVLNNIDEFINTIRKSYSLTTNISKGKPIFKYVPKFINNNLGVHVSEGDIISKTIRHLYRHRPLSEIVPNEYKSIVTSYVDDVMELFKDTDPKFGMALFDTLSDNTLNNIDNVMKAIKIMNNMSNSVHIIGFDYRNTDSIHSNHITLIDADFSVMGATFGGVNAVEFCNKYKKYLIYYITVMILCDSRYKLNARQNKIAPIKYYRICELRTNNKTGDSQIKFELKFN